MSPVIGMESLHQLEARYCRGYGYSRYCTSSFHSWGRWVVVGIVIFAALCFILFCTCCARRRRKKGHKPMYGTGWMAPQGGKWGVGNQNNATQMNTYGQGYNQGGYNQGGYNQGWNQQQPGYNAGAYQQPPAYGQQQQPQYTGTTFNPNDGYYGNQGGYPQQPGNTYQRDAGAFEPPPGPPPGK